jgi:DNA polymerase III alpha subunit
MQQNSSHKLAIRFGLGAIKAVGFNMTDAAVKEREANGKFSDIYDFAQRLDPKTINKKSIEALAKSGSFDSIADDRRQISESFDTLSSYASHQSEAASSNQMSLFAGLPEANKKPELKNVKSWTRVERLQKEFEAFGFFLNEHPVDEFISDLKRRGVIFSDKIERDELEDNILVKMSGVVAASKHRSGPRGRFAYLTISDPLGIFEAMIFDEALITEARDLLNDGSMVTLECLIKKDEGGIRILVRDVKRLEDFIRITAAQNADFEDIKKQAPRREYNGNRNSNSNQKQFEKKSFENKPRQENSKSEAQIQQEKNEAPKAKKILSCVQIIIKERSGIIGIKSLLSQRIAPKDFEKFTAVFFIVMRGGKVTKIALSEKYLLDNADASRLRVLDGIIDVESN